MAYRVDEISNVILNMIVRVYSTGFCLLFDFLNFFFDRFNLESHFSANNQRFFISTRKLGVFCQVTQ